MVDTTNEGAGPNSKPSVNPANTGTMQGMMRHILDKYMQDVDDMLPARVVGFNGDRNNPLVSVQIMYLVTKTDGSTIPMSQLASIPVMTMSGGGFLLSFPIKPGDMGWIKANDQDMSLFFQSGEASPGNTQRMHSFEDGVFIPDIMRGWTIDPVDQENVVLQSLDGTVKLSLSTDTVRMEANSDYVEIGPSGIKSSGDWDHTGKVTITGNIESTGTVKNNGKNIGSTHTHSGVTVGISNTGTPNP